MRHGDHSTPPTVAAIVRRAVDVTHPSGPAEAIEDFLRHYEDRDEPASAIVQRSDREFFETAGRLEGQGEDADLRMTAAVATYLAFRRDALAEDDADLLRLAVRAEYGEHPPAEIAGWLAEAGVEV